LQLCDVQGSSQEPQDVDHSVLSPGDPYFLAWRAGDLPLDPGASMNPSMRIGVDPTVVATPPSSTYHALESASDSLSWAPESASDLVPVSDSVQPGADVAVPDSTSSPMVGFPYATTGSSMPTTLASPHALPATPRAWDLAWRLLDPLRLVWRLQRLGHL
jgi:hypothetical protein